MVFNIGRKNITLVGVGGIILYAVCSLQSNLTTISETGTLMQVRRCWL